MGKAISKENSVQSIYDNLGKPGVNPTVTRSWGHRLVNIGGNKCRLDKLIKKLETEIPSRGNVDPTKKNDLLKKAIALETLTSQSKNTFNFFGSKTDKLNDIIAKLKGEATSKTPKIKIETNKKFEKLKKEKHELVKTADLRERTICNDVQVGQCVLRLWEDKLVLIENKDNFEKNIYQLDSSEINGIEVRKINKDLHTVELKTYETFEDMLADLGSKLVRP